MTLSPIRGAPPGAPIPDFPMDQTPAQPVQPMAAPASGDQPPPCPMRERQRPIEIGGRGISLIFGIIPEQPAIARASMTIHIIAKTVAAPSPSHPLGFLRMSASNARAFLIALRNGAYPVVATGDEDGTWEIELDLAEGAPVVSARERGAGHALHCWNLDRRFDLKAAADGLLADLGA